MPRAIFTGKSYPGKQVGSDTNTTDWSTTSTTYVDTPLSTTLTLAAGSDVLVILAGRCSAITADGDFRAVLGATNGIDMRVAYRTTADHYTGAWLFTNVAAGSTTIKIQGRAVSGGTLYLYNTSWSDTSAMLIIELKK